jgi:hypothetical protein
VGRTIRIGPAVCPIAALNAVSRFQPQVRLRAVPPSRLACLALQQIHCRHQRCGKGRHDAYRSILDGGRTLSAELSHLQISRGKRGNGRFIRVSRRPDGEISRMADLDIVDEAESPLRWRFVIGETPIISQLGYQDWGRP